MIERIKSAGSGLIFFLLWIGIPLALLNYWVYLRPPLQAIQSSPWWTLVGAVLNLIKALLEFILWIGDIGAIALVLWLILKGLFGRIDPVPHRSQFATIPSTNRHTGSKYSHVFLSLLQDPHAIWVLDTNFLMNYVSLIPQLQGTNILDPAVKRELDGIKEDKDSLGNPTERARSSREATRALLDFQDKRDGRLRVQFNDDPSIYSNYKLNSSKADDRVIADAIQLANQKSGEVVLATDDNNVLLVARDLANRHGFQVVSRREMFE